MELEELKETVVKALMSNYDYLVEEAETLVSESASDKPSIWNENADPDSLAKFLDSDDDDE